ncbi:LysR substrate-binding domain-containing protein [Luteimonas sp. RC10]|uniref:LysR substrate-binding domain-containing protein n=1 Tax=Luteimonas sp. RC10 TaxID=2587035 RepID=UPI0016217112|nr:LysR substrate-binding domain-containing protein [Luteimonas sp. RC10]MBB3342419.1 LysR family glycine cleavage system transcriptional activator [Luteimonas sp. RC10]
MHAPPARLPPLSALRAFEAAARRQSFKAAAEELSLTPTAVSHRIRQLEEWLGLRLFTRQVRQVRLTEAGQRLYPSVRGGFDGIAAAIADLQRQTRRPAVTLSTTRGFAARWLLPRLPALAAAAPEVDLHLHAADDPVRLAAGGADLAIRYGPAPGSQVEAWPLLPGRFIPVCAPGLALAGMDALATVPRLRYAWRLQDAHTPDWPRWCRAAGLPDTHGGELGFSDEAHAIQAAIAGQGIALASVALVADALEDGVLQIPFGPALDGHDFRLLAAPDAAQTPAVVAVGSWLRAEAEAFLARHAARFDAASRDARDD